MRQILKANLKHTLLLKSVMQEECIALHFTNNLIWHNTAEMKQ